MPDFSDTRIQLRRGTTAQWNAANPILGSGEPGYDVTSKALKIGDGTTAWSSLSALSGGGSGINSIEEDTSPTLGGELNLASHDIVIDCKNSTGSDISAGTPVYIAGYFSSNGKPLVAPAIGNDSSKMPAIGITNTLIADGDEGTIGILGVVSHVNTNSFDVGDIIYVAPSGGMTNIRPTGVSDLVQNLGMVTRKDASQGKVVLLGAGRSNDVPNSATFIGDVEAASFTKTGGSSSEFLKADGSVDSSTYLTSVSNIDTTNFNAAAIVTEASGISSNDNDTTLPTSAAVKDYVDNNAGTTYTGGSGITISGTTINADLVSDPAGITGASGISNIVYMTQAAYTALGSYDTDTLYYIV